MNPFGWFTKTVVNHPWVTATVFLALTAALSAGIPKIKIDNDIQQFFPKGDNRVDLFNTHRTLFGTDDTTITLLVELPAPLTPKIEAPWLQWIDHLGQDLLELEGVASVGSVTETSTLHGKDGELIISPLFGTNSVFEENFNERFQYLKDSPLTKSSFFSPEHRIALMTIELEEKYGDPNILGEPLAAIRSLVSDRLGQGAITKVHFGGTPFIRHETLQLIQADTQFLFPVSLLVIALLLGYLFRRIPMVVLPLGTILVGTLWTAGAVGWLGIPLSLLSAPFPVLILILGVADGVHFLCRYDAERAQGLNEEESIIAAGTHVGTACLLTSFTTALGFGSLLGTRMDILQSFGMVVALGVGSTYLTVMVLLPCGLRILPFRSKQQQLFQSNLLERIVRWSADSTRSGRIAALGFVLTGLIGIGASYVAIDYFVLKELPPDHPVTTTGHLMNREFGGMSSVEINVSGEVGVFKTPKGLQILEALENVCREVGVQQPVSFASVVKELNRHLGDGSFIPDSGNYIAQLLLLLEMGENFDTESYVTFDYSQARIIGSFPDIGARQFYQFEKKLTKKIEAITSQSGIKAHVTGASSVAALGFHSLLGELTAGLAVAMGIILLIIGLVYRNWRMAVVSIVPNTFPLLFGLACYAAMGEPLNFASAMIFTVIIGIAVDDTIHVLSRYQEERNKGNRGEQAVVIATRASMQAILMTTVILVCGFVVLTFSYFPANRSFGLVGSGLVATALIADLIFLPALLRTFYPDNAGS